MSNPYDTAAERMSVLPRSLRFKGELSADEDLLIQGTIEGVIRHTQRVTVGSEGTVKASISAQTIKVEGTVEGDLHATKSVYVDQSGNLIDQVMMSIHRTPASYTGEDLVEISCHGGTLVTSAF